MPDVRYPAKLLAGYPAAGYPAKSVSGTTLVVSECDHLLPRQDLPQEPASASKSTNVISYMFAKLSSTYLYLHDKLINLINLSILTDKLRLEMFIWGCFLYTCFSENAMDLHSE